MNENLTIDSNGKEFIISCPFWANDLVRNLPTRKWNKSKRAWTAPIIRANVEAIEALTTMAGVVTTDAAYACLQSYHAQREDAGVRGSGFPSWYPFKRQPLPHQMEALNKGYGLHAYALFMDMQTGKSKTSIDMVSAHRMEGHINAVVVFTKKSLRGNWADSFADDCPIPYSMHCPDTDKQKDFERWLYSKHDFKIMVVGWEQLSAGRMPSMVERFLLSHHPVAAIGDETNYIQNHKAGRSELAEAYGRMAEYRYAMTGTPATEGPMKLYQQFQFLDPEIIGIGDYYAFRNRYAIMGGYTPKDGPMRGKPTQIVGYQNLDELMELIAPHTFQFTKEQMGVLPKRYQKRAVDMTKEQMAVYKQIKKEGYIGREDDPHVIENTLELMLRLHQVAGGYTVKKREVSRTNAKGEVKVKAVYDPVEIIAPDKNPKILELESVVEEFRGKKQGLIWAVYQPEIRAIVERMTRMGMRVGELHGLVPEPERQPMVRAFKEGNYDLVVGNAATGGMGFPMHTAEVNIFFNNTHKLRDRLQAEDRNWGLEYKDNGIWIDLMADKTVDVTFYNALKQKEDVHTYVRRRIGEVTKLLDGE